MSVQYINRASFEAKVPMKIDCADTQNKIVIDRSLCRDLKAKIAAHKLDKASHPEPVPKEGYVIEIEVLNLNRGDSISCNMKDSDKIPTFSGQISALHKSMVQHDDGRLFLQINLANVCLAEEADHVASDDNASDFSVSLSDLKRRKDDNEEDALVRSIQDEIEKKSTTDSTA